MTRSFLLLAVPLSLLLPQTSAAQSEPTLPPTHVGEAEREQARHLYDEAIQYGKRGEYRKAKASLLAAWALIKTWEIAVNLGSAEMRLGHYRDAAEHLSWGIRDATRKVGETYAPLAKAKTLLAEAVQHVGQLKLLADEPGAAIFVDEEVVGKSPLSDPLFLDPGEHVITARPANTEQSSLKLEVRVQPGDAMERYLRFSTGSVSTTKAGEGGESVPASASPERDVNLLEPRYIVPISLGGLAAISGGVALAFTIKATAAAGAADDWAQRTGGNCDAPSPACTALADAHERRNDANRIANVAWVGAGVLGAATVATALFWPKPVTPAQAASLRIAPRADMRGLVLTGTFE
jgi:hypothetical protein